MNVVKGAGRARFEANKRHAQRTPLPPKQTSVKAVEELLPASKPIKPRPTAKKASPSPAKKVVPVKAAPQPTETGNRNADRIIETASANGWAVATSSHGPALNVKATRGAETMDFNWEAGRSCRPLGTHEIGGHSEKFNHVTVALKMIETPADVAASAVKEVKSSKAIKAGETTRKVVMRVPFSPSEASDSEVLEAIRAHEVRWTNQYTDIEEVAVVPANGTKTKLDIDDLDDPSTRQLTFCDALGEGYRTMRLSAITYVSPQKVT